MGIRTRYVDGLFVTFLSGHEFHGVSFRTMICERVEERDREYDLQRDIAV